MAWVRLHMRGGRHLWIALHLQHAWRSPPPLVASSHLPSAAIRGVRAAARGGPPARLVPPAPHLHTPHRTALVLANHSLVLNQHAQTWQRDKFPERMSMILELACRHCVMKANRSRCWLPGSSQPSASPVTASPLASVTGSIWAWPPEVRAAWGTVDAADGEAGHVSSAPSDSFDADAARAEQMACERCKIAGGGTRVFPGPHSLATPCVLEAPCTLSSIVRTETS